jgi:hypothetical protein
MFWKKVFKKFANYKLRITNSRFGSLLVYKVKKKQQKKVVDHDLVRLK